jgi:hypothetical protein
MGRADGLSMKAGSWYISFGDGLCFLEVIQSPRAKVRSSILVLFHLNAYKFLPGFSLLK